MYSKAETIVRHYNMEIIPEEGTYFVSTYRAQEQDGVTPSTAILGLYAPELNSFSCFHRLNRDEVWHFHGGDPLELYILHPDKTTQRVVLGSDFTKGELIQFAAPAHSWQGGRTVPGGEYSFYGCTVAPGFTYDCVEAAVTEDLVAEYPDHEEIIRILSLENINPCTPTLEDEA